MAISRGPKTTTNGLVLCLDAADKNSYPGSGTTWSDVSGNAYNSTLVGSPSWNGSKFTFPDSQITTYAILPVLALNNLTSGTIYTLEIVTTFDNTDLEYFLSCAITSNDNYSIMYKNTQLGVFAASLSFGTPPTVSPGETINLTIVNSSGTISLYKNGTFTSTWTGGVCVNDLKLTEGWILNQEQDGILTNFDPAQACAMSTSFIKLYNRTLSATEVLQNYNSTKSRFGL